MIHVRNSLVWLLALLTLLIGLAWAVDHSFLILAPHNYSLAPLGDDGIDAYNQLYPMIFHHVGWSHLLSKYGDHRLGLARVQALLDYYLTNGTQAMQPYRLTFLLWLNCLLFSLLVVVPNKDLKSFSKIFLSGTIFLFLFAGITLANYGSTYMNTWPWIILISMITFSLVNEYTAALNRNASLWVIASLLFLITSFVNTGIFTFSIGLMLWPICLVLMCKSLLNIYMIKPLNHHVYKDTKTVSSVGVQLTYTKQSAYRLQIQFLFIVAMMFLSYYVFYHNTILEILQSMTHHQHTYFIKKYKYLTRILSLPIIPGAALRSGPPNFILGSSILFLSFYYIYRLFKLETWSKPVSLLTGLFVFNMLAVLIISWTRGATPSEYHSAVRFTTPAFMLILCLMTTMLMFAARSDLFKRRFDSVLIVTFFMYFPIMFTWGDFAFGSSSYDMSFWNQFLIAESVGIPIDETFSKQIQQFQNEVDVTALTELNAIQKQHQKGAYSLWIVPFVGKSMDAMGYKTKNSNLQASISLAEFRKIIYNPNGKILEVSLTDPTHSLAKNFEIIFTNSDGLIAGYALSGLSIPSVTERMMFQPSSVYFWRGAVNSHYLMKDNIMNIWIVDRTNHTLINVGSKKFQD